MRFGNVYVVGYVGYVLSVSVRIQHIRHREHIHTLTRTPHTYSKIYTKSTMNTEIDTDCDRETRTHTHTEDTKYHFEKEQKKHVDYMVWIYTHEEHFCWHTRKKTLHTQQLLHTRRARRVLLLLFVDVGGGRRPITHSHYTTTSRQTHIAPVKKW